MARGIFSDSFPDVFDDTLADLFDFGFPPASDGAPPANAKARLPDAPDLPDGLPDGVPGDDFDFGLPVHAAQAAHDHAPTSDDGGSLSAAPTDFGPLFVGPPGGDGPGGGGGGGGGGKPGGGGSKGGPTLHDEYTSGSATGSVDVMNIEVELYGDTAFWDGTLGLALERYLNTAADFFSSIITTGFQNDALMFHSWDQDTAITVDDLLIEVYVQEFKGRNSNLIAAETEIFAGNDFNDNDVVETFTGATITFNLNLMQTLEDWGSLDDTVLHEMIHTLGFGFWEVAENDLTTIDTTTGDIVYTGAGALNNIVEDEGIVGSVGGHWAEAEYDNELMTSIVEDTDTMFLADYTIASLADLSVVSANGESGYQLADNWGAQVAALNGTSTDGGIDLDAWVPVA